MLVACNAHTFLLSSFSRYVELIVSASGQIYREIWIYALQSLKNIVRCQWEARSIFSTTVHKITLTETILTCLNAHIAASDIAVHLQMCEILSYVTSGNSFLTMLQ